MIPATDPAVAPVTDVHLLWRSGIGMSVWVDTTVPEPSIAPELGELLAGRRFRRTIAVVDAGRHRRFVPAATLGVGSAVTLLDATRSLPVAGDVRFYRYLLDGVRRFIAAASVTPAVADIAGEWVVRWQAVPTPSWRAWTAVVADSAPRVLLDNGGGAAIDDLLAELVDHETRSRIAASTSRLGVPAACAPVVGALLPGAEATAPCAPERLSAAAQTWQRWSSSPRATDHTLVFRLHEFEAADDADDLIADDDPWASAWDDPEPDDGVGAAGAARWRLQVCRRTAGGHLEPVQPHRLNSHELDEITTELAAAVRAFGALGAADPDRNSLDFLLPTDLAEILFATGATALGEAGFPVLLPRTIAEVRPTLGIRAVPVPGGGAPAAMVGLREMREFEWRLALGDTSDAITLTDADLDEIARQKGDLVRVRGVWVRADQAALSRAAAFVLTQRATAGAPADFGELFGLITGHATDVPVPVTRVEGLSWLDDIATTGRVLPPELPQPPGLRAQLRPYQQRGLEWLAQLATLGIGGVLADDMGLGKTIQIIALECHERAAGARPPTLIVCPMSVVGNWAAELHRFAPDLSVMIHHGPDRLAGKDFDDRRAAADVVLTTFAIVSRDQQRLGDATWHRIVVDEAQHLKNVNTIAAKSVRSLPSAHRIALTGTPVENRLEDLRATIDLVNPGLLGSASVFRNRYAEPIERERDPAALRRLTAMTAPFILRREKTDPTIAADLPEKSDITVRANLTVEQAALYRAVIDELMVALRDKQQRALRRRNVLAALTRLKQICNHPAHYLADGTGMLHADEHRSGKVELLADTLTTLIAENDRALVFTQFAAFGELLSGWLSPLLGTSVPLLHGGLSRRDRDRLVADFQAGDGPPVLLATLKAGGTGLNLTAANHVVHVDRWWNPAVEDQATDRAYRIGQHQQVTVHRFICVGTIEERIDDMITRKRELSRLTVAAGENWVADLDDTQLHELLALRDEAVSE